MIKADIKFRYLFTKPAGNLILGVFWLLLLLSMFNVYKFDGLQKNASETYKKTEGKIFSSELRTIKGNRMLKHDVIIKYAYRAEGREFTSERVRFNGTRRNFPFKEDAELFIKKYPVGITDVYYDPEDPSMSVLDNSFVDEYSKATIENISVFVFLAIFTFFIGIVRMFLNKE